MAIINTLTHYVIIYTGVETQQQIGSKFTATIWFKFNFQHDSPFGDDNKQSNCANTKFDFHTFYIILIKFIRHAMNYKLTPPPC